MHFDLFHGEGNLNKAIELLDNNYKEDFKKFLDDNTSFNPHNMFMCKTNILKNYYSHYFLGQKNVKIFSDLVIQVTTAQKEYMVFQQKIFIILVYKKLQIFGNTYNR